MQELNLNSKDIASFVVKFCAVQNYFINLTKLQKLIFCCYGVALAEGNIRICKEHPKAWDHGPVFPQVYKLTSKNRGCNLIYCLFKALLYIVTPRLHYRATLF